MPLAFAEELDRLIRARCSLLYVITWEEERARRILADVAAKQEKSLLEWTITDGLRTIDDRTSRPEPEARLREPMKVLNEILQTDIAAIYVLKDFHAYLDSSDVVRQLRDLAWALQSSRKTIVILSPVLKIPPELEKSVTILDLPLPTHQELRDVIKNITRNTRRAGSETVSEETLDRLARAAQGLTLPEAENAFAQALVSGGRLDEQAVHAVVAEKRQIIRKSGILEYYEPFDTLDHVGGMDLLKDWMRKRSRAFSEAARRYGLPQPRGLLLLGVQGCGKSLFAKSIASLWDLPMLALNMSRVFESYIGSSERNMRRALAIAEGLAPAVLWIDEIEKAFSGVEGSASTDAGTTARVVGSFLTWMQERTGAVFVVATANDVQALPPELLRKGRFDDIFFVDLPETEERVEITRIHLERLSRDPANFGLDAIARDSEGFSGAEIEQAIISAMYDSFFEDREVATEDVLRNLSETVPLSRTMSERIELLRLWARDRARPVSRFQPRALPGGET